MANTFSRVLFFIVIIICAGAGALAGLLYYKIELTSRAVLHSGGALFFVGLLFWWYRVHKKSKPLTSNGYRLYIIGLVIVVLPLAYYLWIGLSSGYRATRLAIFDKGFSVVGYQEMPIEWEGFDNPVGLRITLELDYPFQPDGYFRYPKILLGTIQVSSALDAPAESYWQFCSEPVINDTVCLTYPLWPIHSFPEVVAAENSKAQLTYELYPSNLYYRESSNRLCLKRRFPYGRADFGGSEFAILWHLVTPDKSIDLSQRLSDAVAQQSQLMRDRDAVQTWYQGLQSETILAAGYQTCQVKKAILFSEEVECFCRQKDQNNNL